MKRHLIILIIAGLFCSCYLTRQPKNEPINQQIGEYIRANCQENYPCDIRLSDATDFSWDRIYVFDTAVEEETITELIGTTKFNISSGIYSRKWFFVKDNQVIRFEQHLMPEVDKPVDDGSVLLEEEHGEGKYSVFSQDAVFYVMKNNLSDDENYYYLTCINCN